jgi:hypothetical protein
MNIKEGSLVELDTDGQSNFDGSLGIILKVMHNCFDFNALFEIYFFDKNETRWYTRTNFSVLA